MFHYAVLVNTVAVILGSLMGTFLRKGIPDRIKIVMFQSVGLITLGIGISMVMKSNNLLLILMALLVGGVVGELLDIEEKLQRIANVIEGSKGATSFAKGFVTASVLFTVGPMTIIGSLDIGLRGNPNLILVKSLMDFISSIILSSLYGLGVLLSAGWVFLFQGLLVVFSRSMEFLSKPEFLGDFVGLGGLMILAIGIRILELRDIKVGNYLPALAFIPLIDFIAVHLQ